MRCRRPRTNQRAKVSASQDELHRTRLANRTCKALRATAAGDDAEVDLRLTKGRAWSGENDIAHHCELASTAELRDISGRFPKRKNGGNTYSIAADGGNDRLLNLGHEGPALEEVSFVNIRV
jgi:hypothetical protein